MFIWTISDAIGVAFIAVGILIGIFFLACVAGDRIQRRWNRWRGHT